MKKVDFTIIDPMGNITALVETKTPKSRRSIVVKKIMTDYPLIEQVGFINNDKLEMMGGELSINSTNAFGLYLSRKLKRNYFRFYTSGISTPVIFSKSYDGYSEISLQIPCIKIKKLNGFDFVDLGGIGYFVVDSGQARMTDINCLLLFEKFRKRFENKINKNAWGVVFYKGNRIWPVVYVKDRRGKTLEKRLEMACGSGSLAYSLVSKKEEIIQPSGEIIKIKRKEGKFEISGKVKMCYDKRSLYD